VVTSTDASAYRDRKSWLRCPKGWIHALMTLYLTEATDARGCGKRSWPQVLVTAVKL